MQQLPSSEIWNDQKKNDRSTPLSNWECSTEFNCPSGHACLFDGVKKTCVPWLENVRRDDGLCIAPSRDWKKNNIYGDYEEIMNTLSETMKIPFCDEEKVACGAYTCKFDTDEREIKFMMGNTDDKPCDYLQKIVVPKSRITCTPCSF